MFWWNSTYQENPVHRKGQLNLNHYTSNREKKKDKWLYLIEFQPRKLLESSSYNKQNALRIAKVASAHGA